jgi:1-acyl-sn-glycerol-3-phosphate acyltransferase
MLKHQFSSIRVKNPAGLQKRNPDLSTLCFANHSNWWDGLTDFLLTAHLAPDAKLYVMIEELHRLSVLSWVGGFSVDKSTPQAAFRSLHYGLNLLRQDSRNILWLYPQGAVQHQDYHPLQFAQGLAYLVNKMPHLNVIPIAQYYSFIREEKPEIFIYVGTPLTLDEDLRKNRKALNHYFEQLLLGMREAIREDLIQGNLSEYHLLLQGQINPYTTLEQSLHRAGQWVQNILNPWPRHRRSP